MPCDYDSLPHLGIQTLSPYVPGKSIEALAKEKNLTDIIKLASNENPLGCSPNVIKALQSISTTSIATYPTVLHHPLHQQLARWLNIDKSMLTLSNGSDALFSLILTCFALHCNKHVLIHDLAFIAFNIQSNTLGIPVIHTPLKPDWSVDLDALITQCNQKTAIIFIANPNNPTGSLLSYLEIQFLLDHIPESTILVLDEAYYEFQTEPEYRDSIPLLETYPNLVITRTFSKAYGLAGLRLGYAIANPAITSILHRAMLPFTVNIAALTGGLAALEDQNFVQNSIQVVEQGKKQLKQGLLQLQISHLPLHGNFITMHCGGDASALYQALQQYGIIVRPLHPYGLNQYLRVSIGTKQQNCRFLDALSLCIQNQTKDSHDKRSQY